jgi:hypothetical protein
VRRDSIGGLFKVVLCIQIGNEPRPNRSPSRLLDSSPCGKRLGRRIRARQTKNLMTSINQFSDDCRTNEACCASWKNTHTLIS